MKIHTILAAYNPLFYYHTPKHIFVSYYLLISIVVVIIIKILIYFPQHFLMHKCVSTVVEMNALPLQHVRQSTQDTVFLRSFHLCPLKFEYPLQICIV